MFPEATFINNMSTNLIVFEKDIENPLYEGFINYLEINDLKDITLIFKKRLTTKKALDKIKKLTKEVWSIYKEDYKVA